MSPRSLAEHGIEWDEEGAPIGYQIGRAAAIQEWRWRKEADKRGFQGLCKRLYDRRYRATLTPDAKEAAKQRRAAWWQANRAEQIKRCNAWRAHRRRTDPAYREAQLAQQRAAWRAKAAERLAALEYVCQLCGVTWRPDPSKPPYTRPRYCCKKHQARAAYLRRKAAKAKECAT